MCRLINCHDLIVITVMYCRFHVWPILTLICLWLFTVVDCGTPPALPGHTVEARETTFGQTATYQCNTGYRLSGSAARTCQSNGLWSGPAAACIRKCAWESSVSLLSWIALFLDSIFAKNLSVLPPHRVLLMLLSSTPSLFDCHSLLCVHNTSCLLR